MKKEEYLKPEVCVINIKPDECLMSDVGGSEQGVTSSPEGGLPY